MVKRLASPPIGTVQPWNCVSVQVVQGMLKAVTTPTPLPVRSFAFKVGFRNIAGTAFTVMVVAPAPVFAVVVAVTGPSERAIGGCDALTPGAPYASPLIAGGGVVFQSVERKDPRSTGAVAVTPGRLVMSAAVSDSRMRRLALV